MKTETIAEAGQFGFFCTQCGECCKNLSEAHNVYLNEIDIERIANFLHMEVSAFKAAFLTQSESSKTKNYDFYHFSAVGRCRFLSNENRCLIHDVKPFQCANTPFNFFWTGHREYACTKGVSVPADHSSENYDLLFLAQSRRTS